MPRIARLNEVGTARLESIREGLLQAALAIRSIPQGIYAPALRDELPRLTDLIGALNDELRARPEALRTRNAA